jgi:DDE superfamily endonuclease
MEDVLDVYSRPYDPRRPQICMDEAGKQLVKETRTPIAAEPGRPERYDYEYERNGTCNLFVFCQPLTGWRHVEVTERKTKQDWAHAIRDLVDVRFPEAEKIVLVMDNLNTHSPASLYEAFPPEEARRIAGKLEIHPTPKHGSWLDVAEIMIGIMNRQCLSRRMGEAQHVREEVAAWEKDGNAHCKPVQWQFTAQDARIKLKRLYPTL